MGKIKKIHLILTVIIAVHIVLLLQILFYPYPELMVYSYLTDNGMTPYTQIFDQHFPGIMFFPLNLASIGINDPNSLQIVHLSLIGINHIIIFLISKEIFSSSKKAIAVNLLYLLFQPFYEGYVLWIESFVTPFILLSFLFIAKKNLQQKDMFLSGLLIGLALLFKQVVIPLIVVVTLYLIVTDRRWIYYILGYSLAGSLLLWFVAYYSNLHDFIYWTYTFNVTTFADMGRKLPNINQLILSLPVLGAAAFSCIYLIYKRYYDTELFEVYKRSYSLLIIFFLGTLAFAFARYDFIHLQPLLPFAIILLALLLFDKRYLIRNVALAGIVFSSLYMLPNFYEINQRSETVFFGEFEDKLVQAVKENSNKKDDIFAMATTPHIYYLAQRMPPGDVFVFQFPWFMVEVEEEIISGLVNDPPVVVLRDPLASVQNQNLISYMPKINTYVENNYKVVDNIQGVEIMVMK